MLGFYPHPTPLRELVVVSFADDHDLLLSVAFVACSRPQRDRRVPSDKRDKATLRRNLSPPGQL